MLLLSAERLESRRAIANGPLKPLADSLAAELEPWIAKMPAIPVEKALLSRVGGRCEKCSADLEFDPTSPKAHRCPACGTVNAGEYHDRWWLYPYQLWLAERAVHAATLYALRGEARHADFARAILTGYAGRYLAYPNVDNVLGPSRLFFSTYLESLWLLHICIAGDLLESTGDSATADLVRERIVAPAADLISEYHEGLSNRQVWNSAALIAAHAFLGKSVDSAPISDALYDVERILIHAVGADGSWYEGDNYHQFAHRGLWYAIALGEQLGYAFEPSYLGRFEAGFAAPFLSALPDFTYPARKDSRYAASLRQWRFAESCELGIARRDHPVLRWALARMYARDIDDGDTGRARSSGEAERNAAPVRLTRADLGWRSLLFARESAPADAGLAPGSLTILSQGLTIHRRERGEVYVGLDWGESGGGHGHPDRLNLLFSHGSARWLDDLGTGSYVDRSLHWYRSTLAHNAPLINGTSQRRVNGELLAAGARGEFEIAAARVRDIAPGVEVQRTVVTGATYFVDEVRWKSSEPVRFELPIHFEADCTALTFVTHPLDGGGGLEDGFDFTRDALASSIPPGYTVALTAITEARRARASVWTSSRGMLYVAAGPGQPASEMRKFYLVRQEGTGGIVRTVWSWAPQAPKVRFGVDAVTVTSGEVTHTHHISESHWNVEAPGALDVTFELRPQPPAEEVVEAQSEQPEVSPIRLATLRLESSWYSDLPTVERGAFTTFELGERHYRRTEESWSDAGKPRARVAVRAISGALSIHVYVETSIPSFVPADAVNELDNEHPDINGHGVQLYLSTANGNGAWMLVPEHPGPAVRARRIVGWGNAPDPTAEWRRVAGGFEVRMQVQIGDVKEFALDVIANDTAAGRARRRGQLVMSGAEGEFAYLRGDRHDPSRLVPFVIG
jgi:hypothetical protein